MNLRLQTPSVGGISITLERLRLIGFSSPLSHGGKVLVAPCGSSLLATLNRSAIPSELLDLLDARSTRVVVNPGGTNERFVRQQLPRASVQLVAQNAQWAELLAGTADVTFTDEVEARLQALRYPQALCASDTKQTSLEHDIER